MSKFFDETMQSLLDAIAMEYKSIKETKNNTIQETLYIGVDISQIDENWLVVTRRNKNGEFEVVNKFINDEALEVYNKLIGVK